MLPSCILSRRDKPPYFWATQITNLRLASTRRVLAFSALSRPTLIRSLASAAPESRCARLESSAKYPADRRSEKSCAASSVEDASVCWQRSTIGVNRSEISKGTPASVAAPPVSGTSVVSIGSAASSLISSSEPRLMAKSNIACACFSPFRTACVSESSLAAAAGLAAIAASASNMPSSIAIPSVVSFSRVRRPNGNRFNCLV